MVQVPLISHSSARFENSRPEERKEKMALSETYNEALITSLAQVGLAPGSTPLIPKTFKPTVKLILNYGGLEVLHGNYLKTSETVSAPSLALESVDPVSVFFMSL